MADMEFLEFSELFFYWETRGIGLWVCRPSSRGRFTSAHTSLNAGPWSTDLRLRFDGPKKYDYSISGRISRDGQCSSFVGEPAVPGQRSTMAVVAICQTLGSTHARVTGSQWGVSWNKAGKSGILTHGFVEIGAASGRDCDDGWFFL
jgi:hypothetical protein